MSEDEMNEVREWAQHRFDNQASWIFEWSRRVKALDDRLTVIEARTEAPDTRSEEAVDKWGEAVCHFNEGPDRTCDECCLEALVSLTLRAEKAEAAVARVLEALDVWDEQYRDFYGLGDREYTDSLGVEPLPCATVRTDYVREALDPQDTGGQA